MLLQLKEGQRKGWLSEVQFKGVTEKVRAHIRLLNTLESVFQNEFPFSMLLSLSLSVFSRGKYECSVKANCNTVCYSMHLRCFELVLALLVSLSRCLSSLEANINAVWRLL